MKLLMAANWKMHKTAGQARETALELVKALPDLPDDREVVVCPPFTAIAPVTEAFAGKAGFSVGGQNMYAAEQGAFTGEIAPNMLLDLGCGYVLTGHSERRHVLGESNETVGVKTAFGLQAGLKVVLCIGEKIEERKADQVEAVLDAQLDQGLADVPRDIDPEKLAIAYEPVWAIGTGLVAETKDIEAAHAHVRKRLTEIFKDKGTQIRILYGGSVKPENCSEILGVDNVDGVLVGGASLHAESFSRIVLA